MEADNAMETVSSFIRMKGLSDKSSVGSAWMELQHAGFKAGFQSKVKEKGRDVH